MPLEENGMSDVEIEDESPNHTPAPPTASKHSNPKSAPIPPCSAITTLTITLIDQLLSARLLHAKLSILSTMKTVMMASLSNLHAPNNPKCYIAEVAPSQSDSESLSEAEPLPRKTRKTGKRSLKGSSYSRSST
jgi:hypothetical protein